LAVLVGRCAIPFLVRKAYGILEIIVFRQDFVVTMALLTAASNEKDAEEGKETAPNKLGRLFSVCSFEIAVKDGASNDDTQRKHYELNWNNLSRIETLQGLVDVANLHDGCPKENNDENVGDRSRKSTPKSGRQHRRNAFCRKGSVTA
jgi:hypothetical protein